MYLNSHFRVIKNTHNSIILQIKALCGATVHTVRKEHRSERQSHLAVDCWTKRKVVQNPTCHSIFRFSLEHCKGSSKGSSLDVLCRQVFENVSVKLKRILQKSSVTYSSRINSQGWCGLQKTDIKTFGSKELGPVNLLLLIFIHVIHC